MSKLEIAITIGSAFIGLISIWSSTKGRKSRFFAFVGIFFVFVAGFQLAAYKEVASEYSLRLQQIASAERQGNALIENRRFEYTPEGFVFAALTFLEKNSALFPDAYANAQRICEERTCYSDMKNPIETASMMEGFIKGVTTIQSE